MLSFHDRRGKVAIANRELDRDESAVILANLENLEEKLTKVKDSTAADFVSAQDKILTKRLQEIL